jgi:hypothetical protein
MSERPNGQIAKDKVRMSIIVIMPYNVFALQYVASLLSL